MDSKSRTDLQYFKFAGRFFALAILSRVTVDCGLSHHAYKCVC